MLSKTTLLVSLVWLCCAAVLLVGSWALWWVIALDNGLGYIAFPAWIFFIPVSIVVARDLASKIRKRGV